MAGSKREGARAGVDCVRRADQIVIYTDADAARHRDLKAEAIQARVEGSGTTDDGSRSTSQKAHVTQELQ